MEKKIKPIDSKNKDHKPNKMEAQAQEEFLSIHLRM
jgi:hypothetical protein